MNDSEKTQASPDAASKAGDWLSARAVAFLAATGRSSGPAFRGPAFQALRKAVAEVPREPREPDPFADRSAVAGKIEWEGGVFGALDYGIHSEDMPDKDLREVWELLEASFRITGALADAALEMLADE